MSDAPKSAQPDSQAETNTAIGPYGDYVAASVDVVKTIGSRDETHGDPEAFGATFARFLNAYLAPIVAAGRQLGPADSFVILDLMKTARISAGGPQVDHFRDKAGYALLGLVHVQRAFAYLQDQRDAAGAAKAAQDAPEATEADADETEDAEADTGPLDGAALKRDMEAILQSAPPAMPRGVRKPAPAPQDPEPTPTVALPRSAVTAADFDADRERAADADVLRWAMDPGADALADLRDLGHYTGTGDEGLRPGVTQGIVRARVERIRQLLGGVLPSSDKGEADLQEAYARYGLPMPVKAAPAAA